MHPSEEILLAVASGRADIPHRVLMEGHLDGCAGCHATLGEIRWRYLPARGARYATLLRDPCTGSFLHVGHGTFEAGTFASYAAGTKHRPLTEPDEECWILFRLEKPNLFTGWRGWLQRLI
jgi:anti-sigma factor ChrR (cupin superfamily)